MGFVGAWTLKGISDYCIKKDRIRKSAYKEKLYTRVNTGTLCGPLSMWQLQ